ncbi:MAG: serine hydrolase domain-containing protein [Bacteroidota bacterium]
MRLSLLLATCLFFTAGCAQEGSFDSQIDALFDEFNQLTTPGYAIGVSKDGKTIYQKGFGSANLDYNIPITPESKFSIASVSKQFTAACLAILVVEGKVSLDTPASDYIPELKKYDETILIKHLVYNTSGIEDYYRLPRASGESWITFNYFDIDECIETSLGEESLKFKPGDQWDYCNVNFMLITKIVEEVSGVPFAEFAETRLFEPLGMKNSLINDDITAVVKNRVTPYNIRTKDNIEGYTEAGIKVKAEGEYIQHHRNSPHYGGSGVITTVEDLLIWSNNMDHSALGGEAFYELMVATPQFNHNRNNQAFGLYIADFNGRRIIAWDGGDWGISSQLMCFPDQNISITVLSNLGSGEAYRKVNAIGDILMDNGIIE